MSQCFHGAVTIKITCIRETISRLRGIRSTVVGGALWAHAQNTLFTNRTCAPREFRSNSESLYDVATLRAQGALARATRRFSTRTVIAGQLAARTENAAFQWRVCAP